jgi:hypothetical protein
MRRASAGEFHRRCDWAGHTFLINLLETLSSEVLFCRIRQEDQPFDAETLGLFHVAGIDKAADSGSLQIRGNRSRTEQGRIAIYLKSNYTDNRLSLFGDKEVLNMFSHSQSRQ